MSTISVNKKLLLIELNEFSGRLFEMALSTLDLPNIRRMLSMRHSKTLTNDLEEHRGLDPWVQWVSVHTGVDSSNHGIKRLGDVPGLEYPQLWETLSNTGVSTGVWGAMNASKNNAARCKFFLPDPWTFSEPAFPNPLNKLLGLPRYYAKNYLDVNVGHFIKLGSKMALFLLRIPTIWRLGRHLPFILSGLIQFGRKNHYLFSLFDLVSALVFIHYKNVWKPDFSLVFMNSIAHVQHHAWKSENELGKPVVFAVQAMDKTLGELFSSLTDDEEIVVMNALTQRNIVDLKSDVLYRQKNPQKFLREMGIKFSKVEQLMTNDGHVFFSSWSERDKASRILSGAVVDGDPMFEVEVDSEAPNKLFFQLDYWNELDVEANFTINGKTHRFFDYFEKVVKRTGEHVPVGDVYTDAIEFPNELYNHEINRYIVNYFAKT